MLMRALTVAVVLSALVVGSSSWALTNLLPNPGFEADGDADGMPDGWAPQVHTNEGAEGAVAIDRQVQRSGQASLRLDHTSDNSAWVRGSVDRVDTRPDAIYRVDVWVRGNARYNVLLYEFFSDETPYKTNNIAAGSASDQWQQVSATVSTSPKSKYFKLSLIATSKGTVWFDDASLVLISERPSLRVPRVTQAPTVDGHVDEPVWQSAALAEGFMVLGGSGAIAPVSTRARLCFDPEALYIAFECDEPSVGTLVRRTSRDGHEVWNDDCVEVFLDIEHDRSSYLHLGVSASGFKAQERRLGKSWYTDWYSTSGQEAPAPKWSAAVSVGERSWSAELRLPFDQIGGPPQPGTLWGANFCRTRRAGGQEENSVWSYTEGQFYAVPERFGTLVFVTGPAQEPVRVVRQIADPPMPTIVPQPQRVQAGSGVVRITARTPVVVAPDLDTVGAEMLLADLKGRFGLQLQITRGTPGPAGIGVRVDATDSALKPEGYRLTAGGERVEIVGKDPRGAFYGLQTLRQMVTEDDQGPLVHACTIEDWPDIAWRGWHLSGPLQADLDTYHRFIDLLALLKFNQLCLEVNGNLQYQTHPIIARAGAPTKDELKELVAYARACHMLVFPQLATFAHFDYVLQHREYVELAEAPEGTTKGHENRFNYCPLHPRTHQVVFDLMSELIEVFEPEYFHIGRDEASFDDIATCPRCRGIAPAKLYTDDILKLHDWLAQRGIKTLMWGDMYLPSHNGLGQYKVAEGIDNLPRDIIICDWHYDAHYDFDASLKWWEDHGFQVLANPWYEPLNVWRFASKTFEHHLLGYMGTTWSGIRGHIGRFPHLPAAWVLAAENVWSVDKPPIEELSFQPVPTFNRLWNLARPVAKSFRLVDLAPFCNERTVDEGHGGWTGQGPQYDLRNLPTGQIWIGETPFALVDPASNRGLACVMLADETTRPEAYPETVQEIPVAMKASAIRFLHTCSIPRVRLRPFYDRRGERMNTVGWYTVHYEDGGEERLPLTYLANITEWNSQLGPSSALDLWQGHTAAGALVTLAVWEWRNPQPERPITSISFTSALSQARPILLGITVVE